jgi:hypothetical protein
MEKSTAKTANILYGRLSKVKKQKMPWGERGILWENWDELKLNGYLIDFTKEASYKYWADTNSENLCIVERGVATISLNGKLHNINKKYVFKVYPGQAPVIKPKGKFTILSIQMHSSVKIAKRNKVNLSEVEIINTDDVPSKVYEFETLAQEIFTPKYKPGLGLIKFAFVNPIPIHRHPFSGRLIRPISGKGYTFVEPNVYEAHSDTYALFHKNITHTNGNIPGNILRLYAVQLPWIESKIDEEDIAGSPKFVKYVGVTPPKQLWKKKPDFEVLISKLENNS